MTAHDWFVEHRTDFATRTLDDADEATFAAHLERCAECRDEVERIRHDLAWLPMGVAPVPPAPGLRRRIVDGVLERRPARWRRWVAPVAAAAAVLLAAATWLGGRSREAALRAELATRTQEAAALADSLSIMRRAARVLQASIEMDGHTGGLVIFADETSHRWKVVVHGLPPAPPGNRYQFWFITSDGMVRGAEVTAGSRGPAMLTLGMPDGPARVMGAALTLEPVSDTSGPPRGRELVHLML